MYSDYERNREEDLKKNKDINLEKRHILIGKNNRKGIFPRIGQVILYNNKFCYFLQYFR